MTMPTVEAIAAYWSGRPLPGTDYVPCADRHEPDCFACGAWGKYDAEAWGREHSWDRGVTLERAHVVPKALGGSDAVENLVLLCHECHEAAPDTEDPRHMWRWLAAHLRSGDPMTLLMGLDDLRKVEYTGPLKEAFRALLRFPDHQVMLLGREIVSEDREGAVRFSAHFGRGPVVSEATWHVVLSDMLRRIEGRMWRSLPWTQEEMF